MIGVKGSSQVFGPRTEKVKVNDKVKYQKQRWATRCQRILGAINDLQTLELAFPFILLYVAPDGKRYQAAYPEQDGNKLFESPAGIDATAEDKMEVVQPDVWDHILASRDDSRPSKRSRTI